VTAHLVDAGRAERSGACDEAIGHHPHHQRAEVPARAGQAAQHAVGRGLLIEVHRLRIELGGESQDLVAGDMARAECSEPAGREIFEGQGHLGNALRE
jgi:hypothetical protein